jgi:hypothetical protein
VGGAGAHEVGGIAVDAAGNVALTGFYTAADFGAGPLPSPPPDEVSAFVLVLDEQGGTRWSRGIGPLGPMLGAVDMPHVAFDPEGNVVVAGSFTDPVVDLGTGPLQRVGVEDAFVAKIDSAGRPVWSRRFGGPDFQRTAGVAVDPAGNVVLAGTFVDTGPDFGQGPLPAAGSGDVFVAELDPSGNPRWSRSYGGPGADMASAVGADGEGNVLVAGAFAGLVDFGLGPLHGTGTYDLFVAALDRDGHPQWSRSFGSRDSKDITALAVSSAGHLAFAGHDSGSSSHGSYLAALDPAGRTLFTVDRRDTTADPIVLDEAGDLLSVGAPSRTGELTMTAYARTGTLLGGSRFGGKVTTPLVAVLARQARAIVVAGRGEADPVDLGTGPLPAADGEIVVAALPR